VAADEMTGTAQWGAALGAAGLTAAIGGPVLGAIADQTRRRKPWIAAFTAVCVAATAAMWLVEPAPAHVELALVLLAAGTVGAQCAGVFYNAMLPELAAPERIGRWSGWGWGLGYAGGMACLVLALAIVSEPGAALLGLDPDQAEPVRATFVLVAVWFAVFALPLFLFTPDGPARDGRVRVTSWSAAVREGLRQLVATLRNVRENAALLRFVVGWMFCADGLATLFAFGGVFAAGTFDMSEREVIQLGIAMNVTAGIGAGAFAWLDDHLGGKRTMIVSLIGLIVTGTCTFVAQTAGWFFTSALLLGVFVGPVQAASRSYLARTTPERLRTQTFGFYALAGKATAFLGPLLVGWVTYATSSQRLGLGVVVVFFVVALAILASVPDDTSAGARTQR
jgi:UMF1 family MFS transporter